MKPLNALACAGLAFALLARAGAPASGQPASPGFVPGRILVGFRKNVSGARVAALVGAAKAQVVREIPQIGVRVLQLPAGASEAAAARAFGQQPEVAFAEPDWAVAPDATPNDPYFGSQWPLNKISAPQAWDQTTGDSSVIVAILDTGCDPTHPDLATKYVPGYNTFDNNTDTRDVYGHGTAVAGCAAAATSNGTGIASAGWNCRLMPMRISDTSGMGYGHTIAAALTWAADHGARVANVSYRIDFSSTVAEAAAYFASKGGVVTMSAGNNATTFTTPDDPNILVVSATDSADAPASFTNTGTNVDLAAPGVSIYTTNRGGSYGSWSGTSFSAPITAGVVALVVSANPVLTAAELQKVLKDSATDRGAAGWDSGYGWGRINAAAAVSLAVGGGAGPTEDLIAPTVTVTAPASGATVSGTVSVLANASDNVGVASVAFALGGVSLGTDSSSPYSVHWNTTTAANGAHTLTATATDSTGNSASAQVTVTVNNFADTTAPTVAITSPTSGASINRTVSVSVNTADNIGVVKVELYVDGKLTATSTTAPFTTKWNAQKAAAGAHSLICKAYDAAGNGNASAAVSVNK